MSPELQDLHNRIRVCAKKHGLSEGQLLFHVKRLEFEKSMKLVRNSAELIGQSCRELAITLLEFGRTIEAYNARSMIQRHRKH